MRFFFARCVGAIALASFFGCAAPAPIGVELNGFVSERELQVVGLAREGMQLFNDSRFFEAEARFRKALYLDPSLANVKFNLATTLERIGLFEEARGIYLGLIGSEGEKAIYHAALGRLAMSQANYSEGQREFLQARTLAVLDDDKELAVSLSQSLVLLNFGMGNIEEALCESKELLQTTKNVDTLRQNVRLLLSNGATAEAEAVLQNIAPEIVADDTPVSLYLRTLVLNAEGQSHSALELSERVLATPALEPAIDFDLRVVNLSERFLLKDPRIFDSEESIGFVNVLSEALESNPLTSIYWSPRLQSNVRDMLADPSVLELTE